MQSALVDPELVRLLRCPETMQTLKAADPAQLTKLNQLVSRGELRNRAGSVVSEKFDTGLVRSDGKIMYPVCQGIPIMLVEEAVALQT